MPYNAKYIMEWVGNAQVGTDKRYKMLISELEDDSHTYDLINLKGHPSPFVLSYKSEEEFAFSPLRTSDAKITFLFTEEDEVNFTPESFYDLTAKRFLVTFYEHDIPGDTDTLKWSGFLITDLLKYAWQQRTYLELRAIDNLGSLKYIKYSRSDIFEMFNDTELFTTNSNIIKLIAYILSRTGLQLNINVGCNWKYDDLVNGGTYIPVAVIKYFEDICYHQYAGIDYEKYEPVYLHQILTGLLRSLGCILFQSNDSGEWNIININEIGNGDGVVDVRKYDPAGDFITDTTINFEASINTGGDGLKWALSDQLVSINPGIGSVELKNKAKSLNLLNNYGFFMDEDSGDDFPYWNEHGGFDVEPATDTGRPFGERVMRINENELETDPIGIDTIREENFTLFEDTCIAIERFQKKAIIKFRFFYRFFVGGIGVGTEIGSNAMIGLTHGTDVFFVQPDGTWGTSIGPATYLPFFIGEINSGPRSGIRRPSFGQWTNYLTTSKSIQISGLENARVLLGAVRYPSGNSGANTLYVDDVLLNFIPVDLKVREFGYKITRAENDLWITKKVDVPLFHGGTDDFISSFLFSDVFYIERDIQSGEDFVTCVAPHANWLRSWESASADDESNLTSEDLSFKVGRNYISFYRVSGKRFEGTVYGANIGFLRWFNFNVASGHHTMITADFDYGTNFTKIITHEDYSEEEEDYYDDITVKYTHSFDDTLDTPGTQNNNEGSFISL